MSTPGLGTSYPAGHAFLPPTCPGAAGAPPLGGYFILQAITDLARGGDLGPEPWLTPSSGSRPRCPRLEALQEGRALEVPEQPGQTSGLQYFLPKQTKTAAYNSSLRLSPGKS